MRRAGVSVVLAAVLLGACAGTSTRSGSGDAAAAPRIAKPSVNLSGYNAAFKEGYADGCESVRQVQRRNAKRYGTDNDYTMGWNDGYGMCGRR